MTLNYGFCCNSYEAVNENYKIQFKIHCLLQFFFLCICTYMVIVCHGIVTLFGVNLIHMWMTVIVTPAALQEMLNSMPNTSFILGLK